MSELPGAEAGSYRTFGAAAEAPKVTILTPENFAEVKTGGDGVDPAGKCVVEMTFTTNCETEIGDGTYKLAWYDNGQLAVGTQNSTDPISLSLGYGDHQITLAVVDANGKALGNESSRAGVRVRCTKQCVNDPDCTDGFFCSPTACIPKADGTKLCAFGSPPFENCCQDKFECTFGQFCNTSSNLCVSCLADTDCNDKNFCTTDTCGPSGTCSFVKENPLCCDCTIVSDPAQTIAKQCNDSKFCTIDGCDCTTNTCTKTTKTFKQGLCCETGDHASCVDTDVCNVDFCIANICRHSPPLPGTLQGKTCCNNDAGCKDGNVCTTDSCNTTTNICEFTPVNDALCCNNKADCDDGDPKTIDSCNLFQCVNTPDPAYCEFSPQSKIVVNEIFPDPAAVSDNLGEWIELHNQSAAAIDISGWVLTENGAAAASVTISDGIALLVPAGGYVVLCRNGDKTKNGGITCDFTYGTTFTLANGTGGDSVVIKDATGKIHDQVAYDNGVNFPKTTSGTALALTHPGKDNEQGASWKLATATIANSTDKGTPGAKNDVFALFANPTCDDSDSCTTDTCVPVGTLASGLGYGTCKNGNIKIADCCNQVSDCVKPSVCHTATCVASKCNFTLIPAPGCCTTNSACADTLTCNVDLCIGAKC